NRLCCSSILMLAAYAEPANGQSVASVYQATLMESNQKTKEISTVELRKILAEKSAVVFDARPFKEYAISHIPGAVNVSAKPGVSMSFYVSDITEIGRVLKGDKGAAIVLYCNGPFCGKSKRLAAETNGEQMLAPQHASWHIFIHDLLRTFQSFFQQTIIGGEELYR